MRTFSANIVTEFNRHFEDITCRGLIGMDFAKSGEYQKFLESGIWKDKCVRYVEFMEVAMRKQIEPCSSYVE